jgi:hypothetical protein
MGGLSRWSKMKSFNKNIRMKAIKTGGRPTKELGEKRTYMVSVKMDSREYFSLKTKAKSAGISRSDFVRQCISVSKIYPRLTPELNDYIRKLSGMGNNLNQIARRANVEGYTNARQEYLYLADKIDKVIELIEDDGKNSQG